MKACGKTALVGVGLSLIVVTIGLNECKKRESQNITSYTNFIEGFGVWKCLPDTVVKIDPASAEVSIQYLRSSPNFVSSNTLTCSGWRVSNSWFVYIENHNSIWIYDGSRLHLVTIDEEGNTAIFMDNFPAKVPNIVAVHIK